MRVGRRGGAGRYLRISGRRAAGAPVLWHSCGRKGSITFIYLFLPFSSFCPPASSLQSEGRRRTSRISPARAARAAGRGSGRAYGHPRANCCVPAREIAGFTSGWSYWLHRPARRPPPGRHCEPSSCASRYRRVPIESPVHAWAVRRLGEPEGELLQSGQRAIATVQPVSSPLRQPEDIMAP